MNILKTNVEYSVLYFIGVLDWW